jgi:hypothetical protein
LRHGRQFHGFVLFISRGGLPRYDRTEARISSVDRGSAPQVHSAFVPDTGRGGIDDARLVNAGCRFVELAAASSGR